MKRRRTLRFDVWTQTAPRWGKEYATVNESIENVLTFSSPETGDVLTAVLREGAQEMLTRMIRAEVDEWIASHAHLLDDRGRQQVVRNGHLPKRQVLSGLGPVEVTQPRVHDRRPVEQREKFSSRILPPYLRKAKSIEELIPWLYLKGISTGDMSEALEALLGPQVAGLSATTVTRLKSGWEGDHKAWATRPLADKRYVYLWADGVYFNVRLADPGNERQCILVLMGATETGVKELIAICDGYRESEQSWADLLGDCKARGLAIDPKLATGDGALGFWAALAKIYPGTRQQRCWVHKTANVLNKMPKALHGRATSMLHEVWMAETKASANKAFDVFCQTFRAKYAAAVECLEKDREPLLAFYEFPAEHWVHLRTTNPIESVFSTVRLRTNKTRGCGSRIACLTMVFKLMENASKSWRVLNGAALIAEVVAGIVFVDGLKVAA
jgi:putative transposase